MTLPNNDEVLEMAKRLDGHIFVRVKAYVGGRLLCAEFAVTQNEIDALVRPRSNIIALDKHELCLAIDKQNAAMRPERKAHVLAAMLNRTFVALFRSIAEARASEKKDN